MATPLPHTLSLTAYSTSPDYLWQETELRIEWSLLRDGSEITYTATILHNRVMTETGDRTGWQMRTPLPSDHHGIAALLETLSDAGIFEQMAERLEADPTLDSLTLS